MDAESDAAFAARVIGEARAKAGVDGRAGQLAEYERLRSVAEGFGIGQVLPEAFTAATDERFRAEVQRESEARAALTGRVRAALDGHDPVDRDDPFWKACSCGDCPVEGYRAHAAAIAVGVFVEFLRDPPVREVQADGTEVVKWPK